jgi:hypothetical protein
MESEFGGTILIQDSSNEIEASTTSRFGGPLAFVNDTELN